MGTHNAIIDINVKNIDLYRHSPDPIIHKYAKFNHDFLILFFSCFVLFSFITENCLIWFIKECRDDCELALRCNWWRHQHEIIFRRGLRDYVWYPRKLPLMAISRSDLMQGIEIVHQIFFGTWVFLRSLMCFRVCHFCLKIPKLFNGVRSVCFWI